MFINNLGQVFLGAPGEPSDLGNSAPNPPFGSRHLYPREGAGWAEGSVGTWGPPHSHPNLAPHPKAMPNTQTFCGRFSELGVPPGRDLGHLPFKAG